jgi:hypothetical protein
LEKGLRHSPCLPLGKLAEEIKLFTHLVSKYLLSFLHASSVLGLMEADVSKADQTLALVGFTFHQGTGIEKQMPSKRSEENEAGEGLAVGCVEESCGWGRDF